VHSSILINNKPALYMCNRDINLILCLRLTLAYLKLPTLYILSLLDAPITGTAKYLL